MGRVTFYNNINHRIGDDFSIDGSLPTELWVARLYIDHRLPQEPAFAVCQSDDGIEIDLYAIKRKSGNFTVERKWVDD